MADGRHDEIDWRVTTFAGNRRKQNKEFHTLPFREKLAAQEAVGGVGAFFASRRTENCDPVRQAREQVDRARSDL